LITGALRASDFDPTMKNTKITHDRPERASSLFKKWKGGLDDESTLMEKWLTFHDHKWLNFKRPLTNGYYAYCPELECCQTQGDSLEKTLADIKRR
jgi:hypothetical protein